MKPTPVRRKPDLWFCEWCRCTFVMILEADKTLHCAAPHLDDECCHVGDLLYLPDGSTQPAVFDPGKCLPYSTAE